MKTIYWFTIHPTSYHDVLFNALEAQPDINLEVIYSQYILSSHPWRAPLAIGYKSRNFRLQFGLDWTSLFLPFQQSNALFVISSWNLPTTFVLLSLLNLIGRNYVVWTDTPNMDKKRNPVKRWLRSLWLKWIFKGAQKVLVTGEVGVSKIVTLGASAEKAISFPFFLDLNRFKREEDSNFTRPILRFISSGRIINSLKGHDLAIRALAESMSDFNDNWEYVIAGTGQDIKEIEELASSLGINKNLRMLGWVEPDDMIDLYLSSDILIHPSPKHDPFPNAVLEGMAASCVVMASDVSGSAIDRIDHEVNGYLHRAGDWKMLALQIKSILKDENKRKIIGKRARVTSEKWPVERGVNIIKNCIENRN